MSEPPELPPVTQRVSPTEKAKVQVWARSAGRCVLCATSLLDTRSFRHVILTGEMAHNVGATSQDGSPRGDAELTAQERSQEENLLLLCHACHKLIDHRDNRDVYTREWLAAKKADFEGLVARATDFEVLRRTLVVATRSRVRGTSTAISRREVAEALLSAGLVAHVNDGRAVEVVIEMDDDEHQSWAWDRGKHRIDTAIERLGQETAEGKVDHVSVFAMAPIPLLVYLGSRLDDKLTVSLFDRHRTDTSIAWGWQTPSECTKPLAFAVSSEAAPGPATDVVALISVSGSVSPQRIPANLADLPTITLSPVGAVPASGLLNSQQALDDFSESWRELLGHVEAQWPAAERLHVIAAAPASAAVKMGQLRMRDVHPELVVYQRNDEGAYTAAIEVTK